MIEGQEGVTWEQWLALARAAEEAQPRRRSSAPTTTARSAAATRTARSTPGRRSAASPPCTSTLRLGTMVSPVTFRQPSVLAKLVTTADHISSGRVELGLGAGWYESEHDRVRLRRS